MTTAKRIIVLISFLYMLHFFLLIVLPSCKENKEYKRNKNYAAIPLSDIRKGAVLAEQYCQSCHFFPDPALLDATTWEKGVLPNMGPRLGIFYHNNQEYPSALNDPDLDSNFYPAKPVITLEQWQNIIDYYRATSPDTLPPQQRAQSLKEGLPLFEVQVPPVTYTNAATSLVKIYTSGNRRSLIVSDVLRQITYRLNQQLIPMDSIQGNSSIVDIEVHGREWLACNIGQLHPNNGKSGTAQMINLNDNGRMQLASAPLFRNLARPVQVVAADLNGDGREDYLICEFGFLTGALVWMENLSNGQYQRHVLRPLPGAIKAYLQDYNSDGLMDFWVLFAQGEEGIFLFTNKGKGQFAQEEVLRFPAVYGSSYFELADFNQDGHPDIVYTCGDNADYSIILKPYHGVYLFLNDGANHFKQQFFFPINGCYKAIARDFDGDGDLDIATISFFADYKHQPEEGFVYLENKGNFKFEPYTLPEAKQGRWLTMDAGDLDGDGRIDLVLGNFSMGPLPLNTAVDWKKAPPFIILKNRKP
ncbi:MAG: VCBS repeat-containing protein [Flavisolibacter sp.]|nr:VCBS repeat-containing protein [Flavisolibacter sp.]